MSTARRGHDGEHTPLPWMYTEATSIDAGDAPRALQEVYALLLAAGWRAAAETPAAKVKAVDIPPESTAPSSHPSTADASLTSGAARRA